MTQSTKITQAYQSYPDFDVYEYLEQFPQELLLHPEGRRQLAKHRPLLFALIYLRHHITDHQQGISLSPFHLDLLQLAQSWILPPTTPQESRHLVVAPRESGKSTWLFLLIPLWMAAHNHSKFIAAFADSGDQATNHLTTFKRELDTNKLLRNDFPSLTRPARRPSGQTVADRVNMFYAKSGFVFAAKGIESGNLGLKVDEKRPDILILDDIEPGEEKYSPYQAQQRLKTIRDVVFPMNIYARVLVAGTVTMPGSIIHQAVKHIDPNSDHPAEETQWIDDENVQVHHYLPILDEDQPTERSLWPEKWPLPFLKSIRHTQSYQKNYKNNPQGVDGDLWAQRDFTYLPPSLPNDITDEDHPLSRYRFYRKAMFIDPAVTKRRTSDETGIAVLSLWRPNPTYYLSLEPRVSRRPIVVVHEALGVRLLGTPLTDMLNSLVDKHPEIAFARIEINQGGELHRDHLRALHIPIRTHSSRAPKHTRFTWALEHYQQAPTRVIHERNFARLQEQQVTFPNHMHDDIVDAVTSGILYFLGKPSHKRASLTTIIPR